MKVIVLIKNGKMEAKVEGMKGKGCEDVLSLLTEGGKILHEEKTDEYYEAEKEAVIVETGE